MNWKCWVSDPGTLTGGETTQMCVCCVCVLLCLDLGFSLWDIVMEGEFPSLLLPTRCYNDQYWTCSSRAPDKVLWHDFWPVPSGDAVGMFCTSLAHSHPIWLFLGSCHGHCPLPGWTAHCVWLSGALAFWLWASIPSPLSLSLSLSVSFLFRSLLLLVFIIISSSVFCQPGPHPLSALA